MKSCGFFYFPSFYCRRPAPDDDDHVDVLVVMVGVTVALQGVFIVVDRLHSSYLIKD